MEKIYTYNNPTSVSPMGYMGAPAASDCSMHGIVMHKLNI